MSLRNYASMKHDSDDLYEMSRNMPIGYEPPEYPSGLQIALSGEDLAQLGSETAAPGQSMRFSAMGEVTSVYRDMDDSRVEIEVCEFAGEDGKFFDLSMPAHICLCESDMRKMDLDDDAERGDTIHLIGTARVKSTSSTMLGEGCMLQITDLTYVENESEESREG